MIKNNSKGFTLIELLVVIAIIGILASVVLSSLNSSRLLAREAKRASDIRSVMTSLEMYRNQQGEYPVVNLTTAQPACGGLGYCLANPIGSVLVNGGLLAQIPNDPTFVNRTGNYRYCGNATNYIIIRINESTGSWCLPPGQPELMTTCGTAPDFWHLYPAC